MRFLFLCCGKTVAQMKTTVFNLACVSRHRRVDLLTDCYITDSQLWALLLIVQKKKKILKGKLNSLWQNDEMYQLIIVWHPPGRCYKGSFPVLICKDQRSRDMTSPSLFVFICFRLPAETLCLSQFHCFSLRQGSCCPADSTDCTLPERKRDSENERAENICNLK